MLSQSTIQIVRLSAGVLLIVGLMMMARWPIAQWPFAMGELAVTTIGAWVVGMSFHAWWLQRARSSVALPCAIQLAAFGLGLMVVILIYSNRLKLDLSAVLFASALLCAAGAGAIAIFESKRTAIPKESSMPTIVRIGIIGFVLIACYIGGKLVVTKSSSYSDGGIFPERLNEPAMKMFGMFYLSVALAAASTAFSRSIVPMRSFAICGLVVLTMILIASAIHWQLWDFENRPRTAIYISVYALIAICTAIALWITRRPRSG